jgi:hypothetical protein
MYIKYPSKNQTQKKSKKTTPASASTYPRISKRVVAQGFQAAPAYRRARIVLKSPSPIESARPPIPLPLHSPLCPFRSPLLAFHPIPLGTSRSAPLPRARPHAHPTDISNGHLNGHSNRQGGAAQPYFFARSAAFLAAVSYAFFFYWQIMVRPRLDTVPILLQPIPDTAVRPAEGVYKTRTPW